MAWVKLESGRATHRKLRKAGYAARGLDEAAMCQVAEDGTDGFISDETLEMLHSAHAERKGQRLVDILTSDAVHRWERDDDRAGYVIYGYLERNPSAAEWADLIAKRRRGGQARAGTGARAPDGTLAPAHAGTGVPGHAQHEFQPSSSEDEDVNGSSIESSALRILAERRLTVRIGRTPIADKDRWLRSVVDGLARDMRQAIALAPAGMNAQQLADWLEPPAKTPTELRPPGPGRSYASCEKCEDGFVWNEETQTNTPCDHLQAVGA